MKGLRQIPSVAVCRLVAESVRKCGDIRLTAVGTSMVPAIQPGDVLTIQPVSSKGVSCGDIVVYAREDTLVVHRIVRASVDPSGHRLITRGDRLMRDDAPILTDELIGRVSCIERKDRRVNLRAFSTWAEQALCVTLRRSDRATYLFLRANHLWSGLFYKGST